LTKNKERIAMRTRVVHEQHRRRGSGAVSSGQVRSERSIDLRTAAAAANCLYCPISSRHSRSAEVHACVSEWCSRHRRGEARDVV
jgi:hypothetical protein